MRKDLGPDNETAGEKSLRIGSMIGTVMPFVSAIPFLFADSHPRLALSFYFLFVLIYILMQRLFRLKETEPSV